MLVRNLHFSYLPEHGHFCALLDFVGFDWSGPSQCSFGATKDGADRIAGCIPNSVCLLLFSRRRRSGAPCHRTDAAPSAVHVDAIDADLLYDVAYSGGGVVYSSIGSDDHLPGELSARSRHVLTHVCRKGVQAEQALEDRNQIFRATRILMGITGSSENDAFQKLRTLAMHRRQTLASISKQINRLGETTLERAA